MISASGLTNSYGAVKALAGVDLRVAAGTVLGLLGPHGAGKTTVVRVLTTLLRPARGPPVSPDATSSPTQASCASESGSRDSMRPSTRT